MTPSPAVQDSPIFRLPRELRDRIYTMVFVKGAPIWPQTQADEERAVLPVLSVSRQIRAEAYTKIYLKKNNFCFGVESSAQRLVYKFLMCLGENVQFLHSVMVVGIRYGEREC
jgi:hypothetical protein